MWALFAFFVCKSCNIISRHASDFYVFCGGGVRLFPQLHEEYHIENPEKNVIIIWYNRVGLHTVPQTAINTYHKEESIHF